MALMNNINPPLKMALGFIAGAIFALGYPNLFNQGIWGASIIAYGILFYLILNTSKLKTQFLIISSFLICFTALEFYWISHTLQEFGGLPLWISIILNFFFSFLCLPQIWLFLLIFRFKNKLLRVFPPYTLPVVWALILSLIEALMPQQFPIYLGHHWLVLKDKLFLAPIMGASVYSFISYWLILHLSLCKWKGAVLPISIFSLSLILGFVFPLNYQNHSDEMISLRIVQANIGNHLKLASELGTIKSIQEVERRYQKLSHQKNQEEIDLIIWPETAYPSLIRSELVKTQPRYLPQIFKQITQENNSELLFGGYDSNNRKTGFETDFNSAFHLSKQGELLKVYRKRRLIPFGETLPFGSLNKKISQYFPEIAFFGKGQFFSLFQTQKGFKFITPICYEILDSDFIRNYLNEVHTPINVIINLTNDSWYGKTIEPFQHLFLSHWRSLEFQVPIIRSTNTGITSALYPDGSESPRLLTGEEKYIDIKIPLRPTSITPYQKYGQLLWLFFGHICLILTWLIGRLLYKND